MTIIACTYCEHEGEYGAEIEIRVNAKGDGIFACVDQQACDRRDADLEASRDATERENDSETVPA